MLSAKKAILYLAVPLLCFISCQIFDTQALQAAPTPLEEEEKCSLPLVEGKMRMINFLKFASDCLEIPLLYDEAMIEDQVFQFTAMVEVPKSKFQGFFERLLLDKGFVYVITGSGSSALHRILPVPAGNRQTLISPRDSAVAIQPEEVKNYADRGILITVQVPLKNLDARNLMTSLTPYFPNQNFESLRPVETANALILTAPAMKVHQIMKIIERMDTEATRVGNKLIQKMEDFENRIKSLELKIANLEGG